MDTEFLLQLEAVITEFLASYEDDYVPSFKDFAEWVQEMKDVTEEVLDEELDEPTMTAE